MFTHPADICDKEAVNATFYLAWIPESLLDEKGKSEWDKFIKIEEKAADYDDEEGTLSTRRPTHVY